MAASKGAYISLLLPGAHYTPDKTAQQVAFMAQFELQDAAVFCNYILEDGKDADGVPVLLPSVDPTAMFRKIFCGLRVDCSSLLVPRTAMLALGFPTEPVGQAALQGWLLALSRHTALVGMTASLLSAKRPQFSRAERQSLRRLFAAQLPDMVHLVRSGNFDADVFSILGQAAAERLAQGLPLAAWDAGSAARRLLGHGTSTRRAVQSFATPVLRMFLRRLPIGLKRLLRASRPGKASGGGARLDFSAIYQDNGFVGTESLSGAGSTRFQTRVIRHKLPLLLHKLGINSMVDIPCGDFHWMREVDLAHIHYTGADVVDAMVRSNQLRFGGPMRSFQCVNLISGPLPAADLVFCRDCLVHLPYEDALAALETIRQSKCQWLLTTTFTRSTPNTDLDAAGWRALNLTLPPFNLPQPTVLISEKCTEAGGMAGDKSLGLWRIADLPPRAQA
ncbi:hypothetical protein DIC66_02735 [Rhodoferax lacus]|uniref:Class I SAM-dependent methyltransferase n=1 Tax=Rhodoferax lacus TaxID=2184758 RepID=A0A3E1RHH4_9BURK|nr:hypothetical protein DIC66_02735 [Rhodoferax lacus]